MIKNFNKGTQKDPNFEKKSKNDKPKSIRYKKIKGNFLPQFQFDDKCKQEVLSECLCGETFCVMLTDSTIKIEIENIIRLLGGNVIANPVKDRLKFIIADILDFRVKAAIANVLYINVPVVKSSWIRTCHKHNSKVFLAN